MAKTKITIGSRGSDLALWQAHYTRDLLNARYPELAIEIEIIHTMGDRVLDSSLAMIGGKGVFTKEIEVALLEKHVDLAVHSMKDLPTTIADGLTIVAVPERAPVHDVFLARDKSTKLIDLPDGATVATGSLRRKAQLLAKRPDLNVVDIRGNVPTRIRKLQDSTWDGMILAAAGVERLGLTQHVAHPISLEWMLPAVGQGALAFQCRTDDRETIELLAPLNDANVHAAVAAERALLGALGGGCQVPIGAHATVIDDTLDLVACVAELSGASVVRASHSGPVSDAARIGAELAATLLANGGREILDEVFREELPKTSASPHPEA